MLICLFMCRDSTCRFYPRLLLYFNVFKLCSNGITEFRKKLLEMMALLFCVPIFKIDREHTSIVNAAMHYCMLTQFQRLFEDKKKWRLSMPFLHSEITKTILVTKKWVGTKKGNDDFFNIPECPRSMTCNNALSAANKI